MSFVEFWNFWVFGSDSRITGSAERSRAGRRKNFGFLVCFGVPISLGHELVMIHDKYNQCMNAMHVQNECVWIE